MSIDAPVTTLAGIGPQLARGYKKLGIETVRDLLFAFPFRYDDFREVHGIKDVRPGTATTIQGTITAIRTRRSPRKRMTLTEATVEDETGTLTAVWFHQPYLAKTLSVGDIVSLAGKIDDRFGLSIVNPQFEKLRGGQVTHTGRLVPIYSVTGRMAQKGRRNAVSRALEMLDEMTEWIPEDCLHRYDIAPLREAIPELHFPEDQDRFERALRRMKFGELLLHQLMHEQARQVVATMEGIAIPFQEHRIRSFVQTLPFQLTGAQKRAAFAMIKDMETGAPMHRLLEGDVGAGKSVVAAIVALNTVAGGHQVSYLAPTSILAQQQYESFREVLPDLTVALLTQSTQLIGGQSCSRKELEAALMDGRVDIVVGTHALLHGEVVIPRLALVIVDEQHRFGVEQRRALLGRKEGEVVPHFLSMTATPIPRTLAMALYGDMDISIIDELPPNRGSIETVLLRPGQEQQAYVLMTKRLDEGHQAYVVCPFIEASDASDAQSVSDLTQQLTDGPLRRYQVEALHGQMKPKEKQAVMERFKVGETQVLVSTTVIEVGVNVPNASMILIEGAERFGLAQLHQLRGRVRRSERAAMCFLHPSSMSGKTKERLEALVQHDNGFTLAEIDLKLRGAGDRFGTRQSGLQEFEFASLSDHTLIAQAKEAAQAILAEDPELKAHNDLRLELTRLTERLRD